MNDNFFDMNDKSEWKKVDFYVIISSDFYIFM